MSPAVTCLCPTYGRFERLRDAAASFLLQDYAGPKRLLILNDAPTEIMPRRGAQLVCQTRSPGAAHGLDWPAPVCVMNADTRLPTLGHKRQALLEAADTPLVAHWDDDDLYLPWHLRMLVWAYTARQVACVKPRAAWWAVGPPGAFSVRGPCHNVFEGQMLFERERARELGGYPPKQSGQAAALLEAFKRADELYTWNPRDDSISYVYRWGDGLGHASALKNRPTAPAQFGARNHDFGNGEPLVPEADAVAWARERLRPQFDALLQGFVARGGLELMLDVQERLYEAHALERPAPVGAGPSCPTAELVQQPGRGGQPSETEV